MKNSQKEFQMISLGLFLLFKNEGTVILSEGLVLQEAYNIFWHIMLN